MFSMNHKDFESSEKTLFRRQVFWDTKDNQPTWKDIKHIEFQDDDEIKIAHEFDEQNDYWVISVERWVEETDEELAKRLRKIDSYKKELKEKRYQNYLKLKEEFSGTKCFDRMGVELNSGDLVSVQKAGLFTIYRGEDEELYFMPYGTEEKVKDYFSNDLEKMD